MKVTLDVEQGLWMSFLMRAHEENVSPDDVVSAWLRRATRQKRTLLPGLEERSKVLEMKR